MPTVGDPPRKRLSQNRENVSELLTLSIIDEGSVGFLARPNDPSGLTDSSIVRFPRLMRDGIQVDAVKNADRTIAIALSGALRRTFNFYQNIPPCDSRGLHIFLTWNAEFVILYLNGNEAQRIQVAVLSTIDACVRKTYDAVGCCIYCGLKPPSVPCLTTEHIVAEGMGGRVTIPLASCPRHQTITGFFEERVQRDMFGMSRAVLKSYGKPKKTRPKTLPVAFDWEPTKANPKLPDTAAQVGITDYPLILAMPRLDKPGILEGRPPNAPFPDLEGRIVIAQTTETLENFQKLRASRNVNLVAVGHQIDMVCFPKLLAKIAHSFAVAEFGYESFTPFLIDLIDAPRDMITQTAAFFIGCAYDGERRVESIREGHVGRHIVEAFRYGSIMNPTVVVVRVQLFADIEAPVYEVVVGAWR